LSKTSDATSSGAQVRTTPFSADIGNDLVFAQRIVNKMKNNWWQAEPIGWRTETKTVGNKTTKVRDELFLNKIRSEQTGHF